MRTPMLVCTFAVAALGLTGCFAHPGEGSAKECDALTADVIQTHQRITTAMTEAQASEVQAQVDALLERGRGLCRIDWEDSTLAEMGDPQ